MAKLCDFLLALHGLFLCFGSICCIDITLNVEDIEERECYGTNNGFGYSGTRQMHYQRLKQRYSGCTYVHGNLEITNLWWDETMEYDLSFLKTIRYVSGYVLFAIITVDVIPLDNLEIIRGNQTKELMGEEYSLIVALTSSEPRPEKAVKEIHLPRLKEITQGKVLFTQNPELGFVNTIDWEPIMRGHYDHVNFLENPYDESAANPNDTSICPDGLRWGDNPYLCQDVFSYIPCHDHCKGRCYGEAENECCHDTCAVGCSGPYNTDCYICKDYLFEGACEGFCPAMTYRLTQNCVKYSNKN